MQNTISEIKTHNGLPTLFINGEPTPFAAYMSYLDDKARYADFAGIGCKLYSYPIYFAGRGINENSGIGKFRDGLFDVEGVADFSICDHDVELILNACPEAYIFPRICLTMPEWWDEKYPDELNYLKNGETCRVSFSSRQWRKDAGEMLRQLIDHMETSPYADNVVGYQVAAGSTEEWFHFKEGGLGPAAQKGFEEYAKTCALLDNYDGEITLPTLEIYNDMYNGTGEYIAENKLFSAFLEYTSWIVADDIKYFCAIVKECTNRAKITGTFYGYNWTVLNPSAGHLCMKDVLDSPDVDFICSPNAYTNGRSPGVDWQSMPPLDSIRMAGKMLVNECDTRTHLTRPLKESRPIAPPGFYETGLWKGPDREDWSLWLMRRCFARTVITGAGLWWFDMWGGWYASETYMTEIKEYYKLQEEEINFTKRESINQVAVFNDEQAAQKLNLNTGISHRWMTNLQIQLGYCGCGYDLYNMSGADKIPIEQYKLIIFTCIDDNQKNRAFIQQCREKGINLLFTNSGQCPEPSPEPAVLRAEMEKAGVHLYCELGDVLYANRHFLCIHAVTEGTKHITLPRVAKISEFRTQLVWQTTEFEVEMQQYETLLFRLEY